jgi:hypothetical protein
MHFQIKNTLNLTMITFLNPKKKKYIAHAGVRMLSTA